MKKLYQLKKQELFDLYEKFNLPPLDKEDPTVAEIKFDLETNYGITNETLSSWYEKVDTELEKDGKGDYTDFVEAADGTVIVCMDRNNASFAIGRYVFTQARRYVPVDKETAEELVTKHTGFHKATREEIKNNFKL